jgi:hypothetical protein
MTDPDSNTTGDRMSAKELTTVAKEAVADLTGFPPESVSGFQQDGERWLVLVDVCELERIPSTTDVMATYEVQIDGQGEVVGYQRKRRFVRSQAEED